MRFHNQNCPLGVGSIVNHYPAYNIPDIRLNIAKLEKETPLANSILKLWHCCPLLSPCLMLCLLIHPLNLQAIQMLSLSQKKHIHRPEHPAVCGINWGAN